MTRSDGGSTKGDSRGLLAARLARPCAPRLGRAAGPGHVRWGNSPFRRLWLGRCKRLTARQVRPCERSAGNLGVAPDAAGVGSSASFHIAKCFSTGSAAAFLFMTEGLMTEGFATRGFATGGRPPSGAHGGNEFPRPSAARKLAICTAPRAGDAGNGRFPRPVPKTCRPRVTPIRPGGDNDGPAPGGGRCPAVDRALGWRAETCGHRRERWGRACPC